MSSEKENTTGNDDRSISSTSYGGQQNQSPDRRESDSQRDQRSQGAGTIGPKFDKQDQRSPERKDDADTDWERDERFKKPREYKKDELVLNDRSDRT